MSAKKFSIPLAGKKLPPMWRAGADEGTSQLPKNLIVQ